MGNSLPQANQIVDQIKDANFSSNDISSLIELVQPNGDGDIADQKQVQKANPTQGNP